MTNPTDIIANLRDEARRKHRAALERAETAKRDAEKHAVEAEAYERAIRAMGAESAASASKGAVTLPSVVASGQGSTKAGASDKWIGIYRTLHDNADSPYTYEDIEAAVSLNGESATKGGQRTQMMNAVKSGLFERVDAGKFILTNLGLTLIGVSPNENEPPLGGSETGEVGASPDPASLPGYTPSLLSAADLAPRSGREGGD